MAKSVLKFVKTLPFLSYKDIIVIFFRKKSFFLRIYLLFFKRSDIIITCADKFQGGATIMPNIKSAKKRVIVTKTKTARNKARNSALKTAIKKANAAIEANAADKDLLVKDAIKKIDQAEVKGLIHKNNAARKKSALAKKVNG